jgi:putative DNA primase/helicase
MLEESIAMEPVVRITRGLYKSDKTFEAIPIGKVGAYLSRHKDCYERTNPTEADPSSDLNRVYIDLDGDAGDIGEREFTELVDTITQTLKLRIEESVCLMESSKHQLEAISKTGERTYKNKLSFRIQFLKVHGTKDAVEAYVKEYIEVLREHLDGIIAITDDDATTPRLEVDLGVYNRKGRKMRMLGSSKDFGFYKEDRPNRIVSDEPHDVLDTLITYIPEDSIRLPEPVVENVVVMEPVVEVEEVIVGTTTPMPVQRVPAETDAEKEAQNVLLTKAIMGLPAKYYGTYDLWLRVGLICYNEGLGLEAWEAFSKQSPKYTKGGCAEKWLTFSKGNLSQASVWKWLKEDNPTLYAELSPSRNTFYNLIKCYNHAEVAKYFYNLRPDSYLFNEDLQWFQLMPFKTWKHYEKSPSGLLADIWNTMKAEYTEFQRRIESQPQTDAIKAITGLIQRFGKDIGNKHFLEGVAGMLHTFYNDDDLPKKMNESRHLFAFSNKVVDFSEKGLVRDIKPDDYICLHTGYKFPTKANPAVRAEIRKTLMSIWENEEMVDYVMRTIAVNLHGDKRFDKFFVWTGRGGNGKGLLSELIGRTFGDYFHSIPHSCITKTSDRIDAPNPAIANSKGKRFVQAQEPEAEDKLQVGIIKEMTGGGEITARLLHQNPVKQVPQWGLFLQCNTMPVLNKTDGGAERRMEVIYFPFQFVEKPTRAHERPINIDLRDKTAKSPEWRDEFFLMLLETYATIGSSLGTPECVKKETEGYFADNDPLSGWLKEHYETKLEPTLKKYWLPARELMEAFVREVPSQKNITAAIFKGLMERNGVPQERKSNNFKAEIFNDYNNAWEMGERKAGSYYLGIRRRLEED